MNEENRTKIPQKDSNSRKGWTRRSALKALGLTALTAGIVEPVSHLNSTEDGASLKDALGEMFQDHYKRMDKEEIQEVLLRLERTYAKTYQKEIKVSNDLPLQGVVFGYALNLSKCKGYRDCVKACVEENNQNRDSEIEYIRVLEMDKGSQNMETSDHYYDAEEVPQEGKYYMPVQCQQCEDPPCVNACPVKATWKEPDGIVVVDYNWCIGCRYCAASCPYWARKFNWNEPSIPKDEINPQTHYLSNRPRSKGVMEKCTFCLQRTRKGQMPACQEACPTGARIFGNLLDKDSEIRYVIENKTVFRLKEDLNTNPKFWYYTD